jgi:hypothetical protein
MNVRSTLLALAAVAAATLMTGIAVSPAMAQGAAACGAAANHATLSVSQAAF